MKLTRRGLLELTAGMGISRAARGQNGRVYFNIADRVEHPSFWWPRTLISYPAAEGGEFRLAERDSGKAVPFQRSGGRVYFFCDLPSGAVRRFEWGPGRVENPSRTVSESRERDTIVLDAGTLKIRIPASRDVSAGQEAPGPILQVDRGSGWTGGSRLVSPRSPVRRIAAERIAAGPLFVAYRIKYTFDGGRSYTATVRATLDYDFVEFFEEMSGFAKEEGAYVEQAWTGFHPTHRFACQWPDYASDRWKAGPDGEYRWYRIDEPMVVPFCGEDPAFMGPSRVEDPSKEFVFRLAPFAPGVAWETRPHATFWDTRTGDSLGVFVQGHERWQDHDYSLWASADILQVRFRYAGGALYWRWPLVTGTRGTGIACFDRAKHPMRDRIPTTYTRFLHNRYGSVSLDRVKDWVLEYPETNQRPGAVFKQGETRSAGEYVKRFWSTAPPLGIPAGLNQQGGMLQISQRPIYNWIVDGFHRFRDQMSEKERHRIAALLLMDAYVNAGEDIGPVLTMLGGHPNFMADGKSVPPAIAFLFPEHAMAAEWLDGFEKFLELASRFYTRPHVRQWESRGGRWVESIATYNWAFLRPTTIANACALMTDGRNRFANPWLATHGQYLVGALTAPVVIDGREMRIHPPQGAHSDKRPPSIEFRLLGDRMMRYRPLLAEHLLWAAKPDANAFEASGRSNPWTILADPKDPNRGTDPHLRSAKYTGYGIVMRAGVGTADEVSVHVQQIDHGPNYRWGMSEQGGCGAVYYYANRKSFSGHLREDSGDRRDDDAMFTCNFGVYKDGRFKSIGMNVLERPFYDLDIAQFAELLPGAYSAPEYQGRSVMLIGGDYIVIYDAAVNNTYTRFSWAVSEKDEWPFVQIAGGTDSWPTEVSSHERSREVKSRLWQSHAGGGDSLAVVSHRKDLVVDRARRASPLRIKSPAGEDLIFCHKDSLQYDAGNVRFEGRAGVVRRSKDGTLRLVLFHGSRVGADGLTISVDNPDLGVSLTRTKDGAVSGRLFSRSGGALSIEGIPGEFYLDGRKVDSARIPPGDHRWQITWKRPEPMPPAVIRTENRNGGARVFFETVAAADSYRLELSTDNGSTWQRSGETNRDSFDLTGLANGAKVHVRVIAVNADAESRPGPEYPIYVTDKPPLPADGLRLELGERQVRLTWGEVLGVTEYRLYRDSVEIFRGRANEFADRGVDVIPAYDQPGREANSGRKPVRVHRYAVAAVNGNGEGPRCTEIDTDPASWRNWNPKTDLRFKRHTAYVLPPYVDASFTPPKYYPED